MKCSIYLGIWLIVSLTTKTRLKCLVYCLVQLGIRKSVASLSVCFVALCPVTRRRHLLPFNYKKMTQRKAEVKFELCCCTFSPSQGLDLCVAKRNGKLEGQSNGFLSRRWVRVYIYHWLHFSLVNRKTFKNVFSCCSFDSKSIDKRKFSSFNRYRCSLICCLLDGGIYNVYPWWLAYSICIYKLWRFRCILMHTFITIVNGMAVVMQAYVFIHCFNNL